MGCFRDAMERAPLDAVVHGNLIYNLQFLPRLDPREIAAEQARWNQRHARPLAASALPHAPDRDPHRRLRVGYVSPDFRQHPVAFFLTGLLAAHDRAQVEVHAYASVHREDEVTARLRRHTDRWHDVAALTDARLAEKICADRIDILVDLSMHSAANRLLAFARKPAPVQFSWLAYPGKTGLETIDYRLTDATMDPAEENGPERPLRLPDAWCCYEPPADSPEVGELPASRAGHVTFGSLNKFSRLNDEVLRGWARLGRTVPEARWLIVCPEGRCRERIRRLFGEGGVAAERLELVSHRSLPEYLRLFARIDLCLDTWPCNGMTATCHALWMGAPVVTLAGAGPAARAGASLLGVVGLRELVAGTEDEYVHLAAALAGDVPRLTALRTGLRERMQRSPLMDAPRFARHVEAAYRMAWQRWCATRDAGARPAFPSRQ
jgi:predicted O-linked N-acetylglucosamine transferase (SPINDLY family)